VGKLVEFFNKIKDWLMFLHCFVTVASLLVLSLQHHCATIATPLVLPLLAVATAVANLQWSH
jgi:hypothetical protein